MTLEEYNQSRLEQNLQNGHDPRNAIFRANNKNFFTNSECVFVEYCDGVKLPWFVLLTFMQRSPSIGELFDMDQILCLDENGLLEWYLNRRHRNPLYDLCKFDVDSEDLSEREVEFLNDLDELLDEWCNVKDVYDIELTTNITPLLQHIAYTKLVKQIVVYHPTENKFIEEDVKELFGPLAELKTGDINDVISELPTDTLYIFSDAENISVLEDVKGLDYSAILAVQDYKYNWTDDNVYLVNFEELEKQYVFKYGFIIACSADLGEDETDDNNEMK